MIYKSSDYLAILSYKKKSLKWRLNIIAAMKSESKSSEKRRKKIRKPRSFKINREFAIGELDNLPDGIFKRMFRMDREIFTMYMHVLFKIIRLSEGFAEHSAGIMSNCVMAIDGSAVRVRQPRKSEVTNIKS